VTKTAHRLGEVLQQRLGGTVPALARSQLWSWTASSSAHKIWGLPRNPVAEVERQRETISGDIEVFSVEEVLSLVRAADSEQDAAIFLTAAFTGPRRGELIALRWRDVDFANSVLRVRASFAGDVLTTPKSGKVRLVPLAPQVSDVLARLGRRDAWAAGDDDLVFVGEHGG
jgi:integrase